jgi:hypothetical protein
MRELLIDECSGIYIPNVFYRNFDFEAWGLDKSKYSELKDIDHEHYWDAWDDLIRDAKYTDTKGVTWYLEQDGDLFAVSELDEE